MTLPRLVLLLLALFVAAPTARPVEAARPALWAVRDADTTVYLFGTIHVLRPGIDWFAGDVREAFAASDTLVLELVRPDPDAMRAVVERVAASPTPLPRRIGATLDARVQAALQGLGLPAHALDDKDPWFAATMLSVRRLAQAGYRVDAGAETLLADAAARTGKRVEGLETAEGQFAIFDSLSDNAQRHMLAQTLDGLPGIKAETERTIAAWSAGDTATLGQLAARDLKAAPEVRAKLLAQRNARWATWIARRMARPGTVFVAVGAGHLAGEESLVTLLQRRGFSITRVE